MRTLPEGKGGTSVGQVAYNTDPITSTAFGPHSNNLEYKSVPNKSLVQQILYPLEVNSHVGLIYAAK